MNTCGCAGGGVTAFDVTAADEVLSGTFDTALTSELSGVSDDDGISDELSDEMIADDADLEPLEAFLFFDLQLNIPKIIIKIIKKIKIFAMVFVNMHLPAINGRLKFDGANP